jgi:Asp-tRNA(Asn)/Glu-tRNA(Gln) amidotransferase C subunit
MACAEDRHATRHSPYTHRIPVHPLRDQLAAVLTYIDRLRRLDLRSVEPMAVIGERANRLDDDAPGPTLAIAI